MKLILLDHTTKLSYEVTLSSKGGSFFCIHVEKKVKLKELCVCVCVSEREIQHQT